MKKFLNFLSIALFAIVAFTSCSSDEPNPTNPLVGTWQCAEEYDKEGEDNSIITYTFTVDNKVTFLEAYETGEVIEQVTGYYKYDNNAPFIQLLFTAYDEYLDEEETIIDWVQYVNETTIHVYYDTPTGEYYVYKRVK